MTAVERDGAARRSTIIGSAIGVFAEHGFDGASLRELAAAAGMEKGHLTYYFRTKDDILFEVIDDLHQLFVDRLGEWAAVPAATPTQRLRSVFHGHVNLVCASHDQTRVAYEALRFLSVERRQAVTIKRHRYERRLGAMIDEARADGGLAETPTSLLTKAVLGILNWPYQWFTPAGRETGDAIAAVMADRALAALR